MTGTKDLKALEVSGQARTIPLSRSQMLRECAGIFMNQYHGREFRLLAKTENMSETQLRSIPTAGNIFEPLEEYAKKRGLPTDGTVGGIMKAFSLSKDDVHNFACSCHSERHPDLKGPYAYARLIRVADKKS